MTWKGGFQLMQILGLLGMYFDTAVIFVKNFSLLFRFALAILWKNSYLLDHIFSILYDGIKICTFRINLVSIIQNLQRFPIPQTRNWQRTFLYARYSWTALVKYQRYHDKPASFLKSRSNSKWLQKPLQSQLHKIESFAISPPFRQMVKNH